MFGTQRSTLFWILGIGLLLFSLTVFSQVNHPDPAAVVSIILSDLLWVLGSIVVLSLPSFHISIAGKKLIAGIAFIVLLFGVGQSVAIVQTDQSPMKGVKRLTFERVINAPKKATWKAISDVSNYHEVAPNIDSVIVISGEGEGMVRSCSHQADHWTEVATLWEDGERYAFEVDTQAEDYPYPLKYLKGTWEVESLAANQTRIRMVFDFSYKRWLHNVFIHPFMRKQFDKVCDELLDNWQNRLEEGPKEY